ncbi:iron chelate uptake ABC transporter family permease subunit [Nesterenkonia sp. NBAIMH1]|uniref:FecCD family ABC transporter permease n=1 Tax=Nesterenkonia sp. NBAIMH1 TaxID=2600320 RepID=UPI0011B45A7E|nr:iron chelate uptake ABC transporter family permease subunit [Nesterenkonia sp. NBAIMH1]
MTEQQGSQVDFGRESRVLRAGRCSVRLTVRPLLVCALIAAITCALAVYALSAGTYSLTLSDMVDVLTGADQSFNRVVVLEWRAPRILAAIVFGAALGVSGAIFQSLTRNPLASPDVIGFASGSYTGALIVIIVIGGGYGQVAGGALVGGIMTAGLVYLLAYRGGIKGFRLIIVGIGFSAMLSSLNTYMLLRADLDVAMSAAAWGAGSLNSTSWEQVGIGSLAILLLFGVVGPLITPMQQMELGDDAARALGVRVERSRLILILSGVGLTAAVTAAVGPIAFVALAAPQIARRLARSPGIAVWPAAFMGAALLLGADILAQQLPPTPLPVGVVTVVIGGGYLIWLLVHEVRRRA